MTDPALTRLLEACDRLAEYMADWLSPKGIVLRDELAEAVEAVRQKERPGLVQHTPGGIDKAVER